MGEVSGRAVLGIGFGGGLKIKLFGSRALCGHDESPGL